jgi:hypothetical protein
MRASLSTCECVTNVSLGHTQSTSWVPWLQFSEVMSEAGSENPTLHSQHS